MISFKLIQEYIILDLTASSDYDLFDECEVNSDFFLYVYL